jgi:hypothetical protein
MNPGNWIALAMFTLSLMTSLALISFMWGTFRADVRSLRDWIGGHEKESAARDLLLAEHLKAIARLNAQFEEREKITELMMHQFRALNTAADRRNLER